MILIHLDLGRLIVCTVYFTGRILIDCLVLAATNSSVYIPPRLNTVMQYNVNINFYLYKHGESSVKLTVTN